MGKDTFQRIYKFIDKNDCSLTYLAVPAGDGVYDIFRLSLASYMEHCMRIP